MQHELLSNILDILAEGDIKKSLKMTVLIEILSLKMIKSLLNKSALMIHMIGDIQGPN